MLAVSERSVYFQIITLGCGHPLVSLAENTYCLSVSERTAVTVFVCDNVRRIVVLVVRTLFCVASIAVFLLLMWSVLCVLYVHLCPFLKSLPTGLFRISKIHCLGVLMTLKDTLKRLALYPHWDSNPNSRSKNPLHLPLCYRGLTRR